MESKRIREMNITRGVLILIGSVIGSLFFTFIALNLRIEPPIENWDILVIILAPVYILSSIFLGFYMKAKNEKVRLPGLFFFSVGFVSLPVSILLALANVGMFLINMSSLLIVAMWQGLKWLWNIRT